MERIIRATVNTFRGLNEAVRSEVAVRQEIVILVLSIPAAWLISDGLWTGIALVGSVYLVLIVELLNTAIEKLCDRVTNEPDVFVGRVKDMGSAAVGLSLFGTSVVWLAATINFLI